MAYVVTFFGLVVDGVGVSFSFLCLFTVLGGFSPFLFERDASRQQLGSNMLRIMYAMYGQNGHGRAWLANLVGRIRRAWGQL